MFPSADAARFPERARRELADLRPGLSPRDWLDIHGPADVTRWPAGAWSLYGRDPFEGEWCVRIRRRERLENGRLILRTAFFYPPAMPTPPDLPPIRSDSALDMEGCTLGTILLETGVSEPSHGLTLARTTREALAAWLGAGERRVEVDHWSAPDWKVRARWRTAAGTYFLMYEEEPWANRIVAAAWLPVSGLDLVPPTLEERAAAAGIPRLRTLVEIAAVDSAAARPLLELVLGAAALDSAASGSRAPARMDSVVLARLGPWIQAARRLPAERRAAALLIADAALGEAYRGTSAHRREGGALRDTLAALGARSGSAPISHEYNYEHSWLWEADHTAPAGRVRRHARYELLRRGFDTGAACGERFDQFTNVIIHGEAFLADLRARGAGDDLRVHLAVARAYSDIVGLASGTTYGSEYLSGSVEGISPEEARRKAVEHYRAALSALAEARNGAGPAGASPRAVHRRELAREVWRDAWRLTAGMPSLESWFVCIYD